MPEEARHTYPSEYPFHELPNVVLSPHRGGSSADSEDARIEHLSWLIREFSDKGNTPNKVDLTQGY
jgi:phosphoglycerate dehydrogenase-like enzyme